jgi:colanic acid biosynthesis glycosyl transferase WcaI
MRLLIYGPNYAPEKTGTGKYTAEMAEWFAARGHDVQVITGPPHYPEWKLHEGFRNKHWTETRSGVRVRRVPMYIPLGKVTPKRRIRMETSFSIHAARPWLRQLLARTKPDVVIAVCPPMQVGLPPRVFRALCKVPWVFHIQDLQVDAALRLGILGPSRFTRVLYSIEEKLLRKATIVSTITPGMAKRIQEKGVHPDRIWQVPNWSDIQTMRPSERFNAFREQVGAGPSDMLLLYAGNMGKKQGLEIILEAARRLQDDTRLKFVLVGDGAVRHELQAQADGLANVRFLPLQPWERVPEMLNAADVHLVVQKREAADLVMPSKLTNILAVGGCALGTTDSGTLHDVLVDVGHVVSPEDPVALARGIEELANDPGLRAALGQRARTYAEKHLDRDVILTRLEESLVRLTQRPRA